MPNSEESEVPKTCYILKLAVDTRLQIWGYAIKNNAGIIRPQKSAVPTKNRKRSLLSNLSTATHTASLALSLSCKLILNDLEYEHFFYQHNEFFFRKLYVISKYFAAIGPERVNAV
jgi:hypothetical protein